MKDNGPPYSISNLTFPRIVELELSVARKCHTEPPQMSDDWVRSQVAHYWLSVIEEEFLEVRKCVMEEKSDDLNYLVDELAQLGAMCQRAAEFLELCKSLEA